MEEWSNGAGELSSADFFLRFLILQYYILKIMALLASDPSLETHALLFGPHCRLQFRHPHLDILLVILVWIVRAFPHVEQRSLLIDALLKEGSFEKASRLLDLHSLEEGSDVWEFLGDYPHEVVTETVYLAIHQLAKSSSQFDVELGLEQKV